ncbi:hypothetical protein C8R46DRAFT_1027908 [Mycena filopes]|nr:hypothetical protein C8R46DRAFT_1027908 [Mycena filopes]
MTKRRWKGLKTAGESAGEGGWKENGKVALKCRDDLGATPTLERLDSGATRRGTNAGTCANSNFVANVSGLDSGIWEPRTRGCNGANDAGDDEDSWARGWDGTTRSGRAGGGGIDGDTKSSQIDLQDNGSSKLDGADDDCVGYDAEDSREGVGDDIGARLRGDGSGKSRGTTASMELELGAAICDLNCDTMTCGCGMNCELEDGINDVYGAVELDGWTTR